MRIDLPPMIVAAGALNSPTGVHTGKTMMMPELRLLLDAKPGRVPLEDYADAIIEDNVLQKNTATTKRHTFAELRQLYGLRGDIPIFAALRILWPIATEGQPMISVLCAVARDPLLRSTADYVLSLAIDDPTGPAALGAEVGRSFPNHYGAGTLDHIGRNTGASWVQAGLLRRVFPKYRSRPVISLSATVYALYLGHLGGLAGPALFTSLWARLLDMDAASIRIAAENAARAGWLEYASSGGMMEIGFRHLDERVAREAV